MKKAAGALLVLVALTACGTSSPPFTADDAGVDAGDASVGCPTGQTSCSGTCVDTQATATACGGCGLVCAKGESCCAGSCSSDPSCGLVVTALDVSKGYVNGGAYVTIKGKGFAAGLRASIGDGRAPVRVIDASTALLVTPPAPVGAYDVHVALGSYTATLPGAFTYRTEGFEKQWTEVSMSTPRGNFPAMTTLQDGRVLIVGGTSTSQPSSSLASAELYDPQTHVITPAANDMTVPRNTVSAITLLDGRALVVGACNVATGSGCLQAGDRAVADLFDPATNKFTEAKGKLGDTTRVYMRLMMLPDGRVLVTSNGKATGEIFDPVTETFTPLGVTSANQQFGFPTKLRDGRIAFVSATSEIYDPDTGTLGPLNAPLPHGAVAVLTLPDGRVMSPGGADLVGTDITPTDQITLVDVAKPQVTPLGNKLSSPRLKFASALLGDGTVMVAGGVDAPYPMTYGCQSNTFPTTDAVDVVDAAAGTVTPFPPLNDHNMELVATTLLDGSIVVGGGAPCGGAGAYAYVYFLKSVPPPN